MIFMKGFGPASQREVSMPGRYIPDRRLSPKSRYLGFASGLDQSDRGQDRDDQCKRGIGDAFPFQRHGIQKILDPQDRSARNGDRGFLNVLAKKGLQEGHALGNTS